MDNGALFFGRKRIVDYFSSYVVLEELPNAYPHANI